MACRMKEFSNYRCRRLICCRLLSLPILFLFATAAFAHPVPPANAVLELQSSGECELRITCDVSSLVMQTMPGHLGKAAEELKSLSQEELAARVEDAQAALEFYLQLTFDGVQVKLPEIRLPELDVIRNGAAHGGEEAWPEITLAGHWPESAQQCEITFPAALGKVQFKLERDGATLISRALTAGEPSGSISLKGSTAQQPLHGENRAGWIMVGVLLAYLILLYLRRPKHDTQYYSRNTSTGQ